MDPINGASDVDGVVVAGAVSNPDMVPLGGPSVQPTERSCTANVTVQLRLATGPMGEGSGAAGGWDGT